MEYVYTWDVVISNSEGVKITNREFDTLTEAYTCAITTELKFASEVTAVVWEVRRCVSAPMDA